MKIIFISENRSKARQLNLNGWAKVLLSICLLGMPLAGGLILGLEVAGTRYGVMVDTAFADVKDDLEQQRAELTQAEQLSATKVAALTQKLAEMQARLMRLDALGGRLIEVADLDDGEFDFSVAPAVGGPEESFAEAPDEQFLEHYYQQIASQLDANEDQLLILQSVLRDSQSKKQNTLTGRPVKWGWLSSKYGYRADPFSGKRTWHNGVDFAGREGGDVIAIASGIVTWSGEKHGYGNMVELDHGKGYVTRYAHNLENRVAVGDLVKKGQLVALMGSTGRSTGPHVHFEVYKNGRSVDPASYIRRNLR